MPVRGVRGAITITENNATNIIDATREMLEAIMASNPSMKPDDIASALFTVTGDLSAEFPARAARQMGWHFVPLVCAQEIPVPGSLPLCIRVLLHWNTDLPQVAVQHVYLRDAVILRPDLTGVK